MSELNLEAFSQRADQVATEDLLSSINGGTEGDCHPEEDSAGQQIWDAFWEGVKGGLGPRN